MAERIESTAIGIAKLSNVAFDNKFLDIGTEAKVVIPSSRIHHHDQFHIDSYATEPKFLKCAGICVMGKNLKGDMDCIQAREEERLTAGRNALLHQGIYATDTFGSPELRAGISGSVLVRMKRASPTEKTSCLNDGEICGIMHGDDLDMKCSKPTLSTFFCLLTRSLNRGGSVSEGARVRVLPATEEVGDMTCALRRIFEGI